MISKQMQAQVESSSVIRAMFEEGKRLASVYGADNVFDFSLGNPSVEPPAEIKTALLDILQEKNSAGIHGYMNNSGFESVRDAIAQSLNRRFHTNFSQNNIIMTVGAAGGLNVIFKTLLDPQDEVIVFAPFFGEYRNYVSNYQGKLIVIPADTASFQPNLAMLQEMITAQTKAVIVNSPNNPTGVVYSSATIHQLADILRNKQKEFATNIYLVADEPYRELAYDNVEVPYLTKFYNNTIIGYSFSKSLSLPGERIGYLVIPDQATDAENIIAAANIATRIMGFVNAPSLFQLVIARCLEAKVDVEAYNRNRELIYHALRDYGYECIKPEGAFYLFVKAPNDDDIAFCNLAKQKNILVVPGSSFGCAGYFRIAYCVNEETIRKSLPGFETLIKEVKG